MDNPFPVPCSWAVRLRALPLAISAKLKCCHPHEEMSLPACLQELAVMTWPATPKLLEDADSASWRLSSLLACSGASFWTMLALLMMVRVLGSVPLQSE